MNPTTQTQTQTQPATHTPGPWSLELARWKADAPIFGFAITVSGKEPFLCSAGVSDRNNHTLIVAAEHRAQITTGFTEAEVEANARLIAAAPDLLAACMELIEWGIDDLQKRQLPEDSPEGKILLQARSAISKAHGCT